MPALVEHLKTKGFIYSGSEIYGGLANAWDYGHYGAMLKDNIRSAWVRAFVNTRTDMTLLDSAILMNPAVWKASGHIDGFSDPLVDCKTCKTRHRADKLIEAATDINPEGLEVTAFREHYIKNHADVPSEVREGSLNDFMHYILNKHIPSPDAPTGTKPDWTPIRNFNLMFATKQGVTEDSSATVYLRPETAQGIFVNFANIARTSRKKVPFGVAQVGKAFRNEITPGNFIFRTREFEQMEIEYFAHPDEAMALYAKWIDDCEQFLLKVIGLNGEKLRRRVIGRAHV